MVEKQTNLHIAITVWNKSLAYFQLSKVVFITWYVFIVMCKFKLLATFPGISQTSIDCGTCKVSSDLSIFSTKLNILCHLLTNFGGIGTFSSPCQSSREE
jgi:hypothetical protein